MNDWIVFGLALSLVCGGMVAGRRMGGLAAWWLAFGAWLAFRLADRTWKPVVTDMRAADPGMDLAVWMPLVYGMFFAVILIPTAVWIAIVQPKQDAPLPPKVEDILGIVGGLVAGLVLLLAAVQSHVMHPLAKEKMPATMSLAEPTLSALGQQHVGVPKPVPAPVPATPAAKPRR